MPVNVTVMSGVQVLSVSIPGRADLHIKTNPKIAILRIINNYIYYSTTKT